MSLLLDAIYLVVALATAPFWMRKARGGWSERFGRVEPLPPPGDTPRVMLHAVSVGETNLLRALVDDLRLDHEVVVTCTTDTGIARARELFADSARVVRYPLDASWSVRRFLDAVRPDCVALAELELWPNFARACARRDVPMAIINGRLSDRSHGRYRLARPVLGKWFGALRFVSVQDDTYARRFVRAGARPERVHVVGSMKWDAAPIVNEGDDVPGAAELARDMGIDRNRPLVVAGSTAPEEHALLRDALPPGVQLLCAPRRPEWFDPAAADLPGCVRRTSGGGDPSSGRFLLDTIGELRKAYALADVVVVGRSFGDLHGSDPMEPAALGKPVVIGPAFADFRNAVETMRAEGAIVITTRDTLGRDLERLLRDDALRAQLGQNARACVERNRGATARTASMLRGMASEAKAKRAVTATGAREPRAAAGAAR